MKVLYDTFSFKKFPLLFVLMVLRASNFTNRSLGSECRCDIRLKKYEPISTDHSVIISGKDSRKFLENIGIEGEIVLTPSHSEDSISLILDNGICFVGDLEPIEYLNSYDENIKLKADWNLVMSYHPKIICYAHANEKYCN